MLFFKRRARGRWPGPSSMSARRDGWGNTSPRAGRFPSRPAGTAPCHGDLHTLRKTHTVQRDPLPSRTSDDRLPGVVWSWPPFHLLEVNFCGLWSGKSTAHSGPGRCLPGFSPLRPSCPGTTIRRRIIGVKMTQVNHAFRVDFRAVPTQRSSDFVPWGTSGASLPSKRRRSVTSTSAERFPCWERFHQSDYSLLPRSNTYPPL